MINPFLVRNQDTGEVYDIREIDELHNVIEGGNSEYLEKLKKKQKNIWNDWWKKKRENNLKFLENIKKNNYIEAENLINENIHGDLKAEINIKDELDWTPLHYTSLCGNYKLTLLLLKNEADIEAQNNIKQTPLIIAAQRGHANIVNLLISAGCEINAEDIYNNTAFHYACIYNFKEVIEILLARPSLNVNIRNMENKEATELITNKEIRSVVERHLSEIVFNQKNENLITIYKTNNGNVKKMFENIGSNNESEKGKEKEKNNTERNNSSIHYRNSLNQSLNTITNNTNTGSYTSNNSDEEKTIGLSNFQILGLIGKGSFGEVFLVNKKNTISMPNLTNPNTNIKNEIYAMKVLHKQSVFKHNLIKYALTERNVLANIDHPFIVKLHYAFQSNDELFLILDFCPGADLAKYLIREKKFDENKAKFYLAEILLALENLHKRDIIYRDLKPENVVLNEEGHAMLTDFGLSKEGVFDNITGAKSFCGSIAYLAPEILKKKGHGKAVDWYLLGVLLYEMLVGKPPFYNTDREKMFQNMEMSTLELPNELSIQAKSILKGLLQRNPINRLGGGPKDSEEIKSHKFFENVNWNDIYEKKLKPPKPYLMNTSIFKTKFPINLNIDEKKNNEKDNNFVIGWSFVGNNNPNI